MQLVCSKENCVLLINLFYLNVARDFLPDQNFAGGKRWPMHVVVISHEASATNLMTNLLLQSVPFTSEKLH